MQGYAGSIAFDAVGATLAITSPRGGRVQAFSADGAAAWSLARADVCGIGPGGAGFVVTDGQGLVASVAAGQLQPLVRTDVAWDNHLVALI